MRKEEEVKIKTRAKYKVKAKYNELEKRRRGKFNEAFDMLAELLPNYDPAAKVPKIDIVERSAQFVKDLRLSNSRLVSSQFDTDEKCKLIKELQDEVNKLIIRVKQLTALLKNSNIAIPNGPDIKALKKQKVCDKSNSDDEPPVLQSENDFTSSESNGEVPPNCTKDVSGAVNSRSNGAVDNVSSPAEVTFQLAKKSSPNTKRTNTTKDCEANAEVLPQEASQPLKSPTEIPNPKIPCSQKLDGSPTTPTPPPVETNTFTSTGTTTTTTTTTTTFNTIPIPLLPGGPITTVFSEPIKNTTTHSHMFPMQTIFITNPLSTTSIPTLSFGAPGLLQSGIGGLTAFFQKLPISPIRKPVPKRKRTRRKKIPKIKIETKEIEETITDAPTTQGTESAVPDDTENNTTPNLPESVEESASKLLEDTANPVLPPSDQVSGSDQIASANTSDISEEGTEETQLQLFAQDPNETVVEIEIRTSPAPVEKEACGLLVQNNFNVQENIVVSDGVQTSNPSGDCEGEPITPPPIHTNTPIENENQSLFQASAPLDDEIVSGKTPESESSTIEIPNRLIEVQVRPDEVCDDQVSSLHKDIRDISETTGASLVLQEEQETSTLAFDQPLDLDSVSTPTTSSTSAVVSDKISECIARSIDLIDAPDGELMELGETWGDPTHSPRSPVSPTQTFLNMFPLLPKDSTATISSDASSIVASEKMAQSTQHSVQTLQNVKHHNSVPSSSGQQGSHKSFFIDYMLPEDHGLQPTSASSYTSKTRTRGSETIVVTAAIPSTSVITSAVASSKESFKHSEASPPKKVSTSAKWPSIPECPNEPSLKSTTLTALSSKTTTVSKKAVEVSEVRPDYKAMQRPYNTTMPALQPLGELHGLNESVDFSVFSVDSLPHFSEPEIMRESYNKSRNIFDFTSHFSNDTDYTLPTTSGTPIPSFSSQSFQSLSLINKPEQTVSASRSTASSFSSITFPDMPITTNKPSATSTSYSTSSASSDIVQRPIADSIRKQKRAYSNSQNDKEYSQHAPAPSLSQPRPYTSQTTLPTSSPTKTTAPPSQTRQLFRPQLGDYSTSKKGRTNQSPLQPQDIVSTNPSLDKRSSYLNQTILCNSQIPQFGFSNSRQNTFPCTSFSHDQYNPIPSEAILLKRPTANGPITTDSPAKRSRTSGRETVEKRALNNSVASTTMSSNQAKPKKAQKDNAKEPPPKKPCGRNNVPSEPTIPRGSSGFRANSELAIEESQQMFGIHSHHHQSFQQNPSFSIFPEFQLSLDNNNVNYDYSTDFIPAPSTNTLPTPSYPSQFNNQIQTCHLTNQTAQTSNEHRPPANINATNRSRPTPFYLQDVGCDNLQGRSQYPQSSNNSSANHSSCISSKSVIQPTGGNHYSQTTYMSPSSTSLTPSAHIHPPHNQYFRTSPSQSQSQPLSNQSFHLNNTGSIHHVSQPSNNNISNSRTCQSHTNVQNASRTQASLHSVGPQYAHSHYSTQQHQVQQSNATVVPSSQNMDQRTSSSLAPASSSSSSYAHGSINWMAEPYSQPILPLSATSSHNFAQPRGRKSNPSPKPNPFSVSKLVGLNANTSGNNIPPSVALPTTTNTNPTITSTSAVIGSTGGNSRPSSNAQNRSQTASQSTSGKYCAESLIQKNFSSPGIQNQSSLNLSWSHNKQDLSHPFLTPPSSHHHFNMDVNPTPHPHHPPSTGLSHVHQIQNELGHCANPPNYMGVDDFNFSTGYNFHSHQNLHRNQQQDNSYEGYSAAYVHQPHQQSSQSHHQHHNHHHQAYNHDVQSQTQGGHGTSSVSNFNLSSIFPEINDNKRHQGGVASSSSSTKQNPGSGHEEQRGIGGGGGNNPGVGYFSHSHPHSQHQSTSHALNSGK